MAVALRAILSTFSSAKKSPEVASFKLERTRNLQRHWSPPNEKDVESNMISLVPTLFPTVSPTSSPTIVIPGITDPEDGGNETNDAGPNSGGIGAGTVSAIAVGGAILVIGAAYLSRRSAVAASASQAADGGSAV